MTSEGVSLASLCGASHSWQLPFTGSMSNSSGQKHGFWVSELSWGGKNFNLKQIFWCQKLTVWYFAVHGCSFLSLFAIGLRQDQRSNIANIQVYTYCVSQL